MTTATSTATSTAVAAPQTIEERTREVVAVIREHAEAVDEAASFPLESLKALRTSGLMGLLVPARYGGLGGDLRDLVSVGMEMAGACVSTAMIWTMHCQQVAGVVAFGRPALCRRLLPQIARGEVYLASVTTERGTGGHLLTADQAMDHLHVRRDAPIVTGGEHADGFLITMRDLPDAPPNAVSLVYAPREALSLRSNGSWNPMGMRGTHSVGLELEGDIEPDAIVGAPGDFKTVAVTTFAPVGHIAWAACWLGAARGALRAVLRLLRKPADRGSLAPDSELLRHRVARVRMELDVMAALLSQCVADAEDPARIESIPVQLRLNALKVHVAERSLHVVDTLIEMVGLRHGYLRDSPMRLERVFRDLRSASLNYANDRLLAANGALALLDQDVHLAY
jgi:acyl-CoA dehydrogenase